MRTRDAGVVISNATRVTMKTQLMRKATGNHLMKPTSLENAPSRVSGFYYARNRVCDAVLGKDSGGL